MSKRLLLTKVVVQAHFVVVDGDVAEEVTVQPVEVSAAEWPTYATTEFAEGFEKLRAQLEPPS